MTPRQLVVDALELRAPERTPRQLWTLPWAERTWPDELAAIRRRFPDDLVMAPGFLRQPLRTVGEEYETGTFVDEWGCRFESRQAGIIGEVKEPLLPAWDDLGRLREPRERLTVDRGAVDDFCARSDAFVYARTIVRPFELLQFLRGPENLYVDLAERPAALFRLIERIQDFYLEEMRLWADTDVDALFCADDWGSQNALLISPGLWRELFKPLYRAYAEIAHRNGKYLFMHSDGHIAAILPDLVEIGVDALNAQVFCMDIEDLGRRFAGRLAFWGEVDRQHLLARGAPDEVRAAVGRLRRAFDRRGGVIAQCEFGIGARPENVAAVFEAWNETAA